MHVSSSVTMRRNVLVAVLTLTRATQLWCQPTAPTMMRFNTDKENAKIANNSLEFVKIIKEDLRRNNDDYAELRQRQRLLNRPPQRAPPPEPPGPQPPCAPTRGLPIREPMTPEMARHEPPVNNPQLINSPLRHPPLGNPSFHNPPTRHQPVGPHSLGQHSVGYQILGRQSVGHQSLGHQSLGQQSIGHQPLGHKPLGHQPSGHRPMGQQQLNHKPLEHLPISHPPSSHPPQRSPPLDYPLPSNPHSRSTPSLRNPSSHNPPLRNLPVRNPPVRIPPKRNPPIRVPHSFPVDTRRTLNISENQTTIATAASTSLGSGRSHEPNATLFRSNTDHPKPFKKVRVDKLKALINKGKTRLREMARAAAAAPAEASADSEPSRPRRKRRRTTGPGPAKSSELEQVDPLLRQQREGPMPLSPSPDQIDMAPARGAHIHVSRLKGRLCQRNMLNPEGPKYDSKGSTIMPAHNPELAYGRQFPQTRAPAILLPRCCNCCKKSVLGCQ